MRDDIYSRQRIVKTIESIFSLVFYGALFLLVGALRLDPLRLVLLILLLDILRLVLLILLGALTAWNRNSKPFPMGV